MENREGKLFRDLMNATTEYYGKPQLSSPLLGMYFNGLTSYTFDQVQYAVSRHLGNTKNGQFMPKIGDIVRHIEGEDVSIDQVIASARNPLTPFGVLCRIEIGTSDLDNPINAFYLKQRAQECIDLLPEWRRMAADGTYNNHAISVMLKHKVNPHGAFMKGLAYPAKSVILSNRICKIQGSKQHERLLGPGQTCNNAALPVDALQRIQNLKDIVA